MISYKDFTTVSSDTKLAKVPHYMCQTIIYFEKAKSGFVLSKQNYYSTYAAVRGLVREIQNLLILYKVPYTLIRHLLNLFH